MGLYTLAAVFLLAVEGECAVSGRAAAQVPLKPEYLETETDSSFDPLCAWSPRRRAGLQCLARSVHLCAEWERLRRSSREDTIDAYTRYYFDTVCRKKNGRTGTPCIQINNLFECENLDNDSGTPPAESIPFVNDVPTEVLRERRRAVENSCEWRGAELETPWGSCEGRTARINDLILEMQDVFHEEGLVSKQAQFSYIVNVFDCMQICMDSSLSVLKAYCPTLKHCCQWDDGLRTCTASNTKIAKRYNPRLAKLAKIQYTCKTQSSWDTCAAVSAASLA